VLISKPNITKLKKGENKKANTQAQTFPSFVKWKRDGHRSEIASDFSGWWKKGACGRNRNIHGAMEIGYSYNSNKSISLYSSGWLSI